MNWILIIILTGPFSGIPTTAMFTTEQECLEAFAQEKEEPYDIRGGCFYVRADAEPYPMIHATGNLGYMLRCGLPPETTWVDCHRMAGSLCPSGYTLLGRDGFPLTASNQTLAPLHHLVLECNK